jgi:hypothetical protein
VAFLIEPVLRHYGGEPPKEGFGWQRMRCPFHDDSHASAAIHYERNAFYCQVCAWGGGALTVIMRWEGKDLAGAIEVAESIPGAGNGEVPRRGRKSGPVFGEPGTVEGVRDLFPTRLRG